MRDSCSKTLKSALPTTAFVLLSLALLFVVEFSQRRDFWLTVAWPQSQGAPRLSSLHAFIYSWSLIFASLVLLTGVFRSALAGAMAGTALAGTFAYINYRKFAILQDWLRPGDVSSMFDDASFVAPFITGWDALAGVRTGCR